MDVTVERKDIAALLESLCEHPLADGQAQSSPEVEALRRAAAQAFREDSAARGEGSDAIEATRLRAALAALMSGTAGEGERRIVVDAVLQSPAARLDVQSAQAFVGAIEHSLQSAPARLVDEILAREGARSAGSVAVRERAGSANIWSRIVGRSWPAKGWRVAALCTLLMVISVAPLLRTQTNPALETAPPSPIAETASKPTAVVASPAQRALTTGQPCAPRHTSDATNAKSIAPAEPPTAAVPAEPTAAVSTAAADCSPAPVRTFAEDPAKEIEAAAARQRAEAAGQAAAASETAKVGAARADHSPPGSPIEVNRSGPAFGTKGRTIRTPAVAAPPAAPATPQASSAGQQ
jgi:hypothetical protein